MQALYDTRNRAERIVFAHRKRNEGYTINDIALLLHSATTTVREYLAIPENEIPEIQENARERQYIQGLENKQLAINEVRQLYAGGHSIEGIINFDETNIRAYSVKQWVDLRKHSLSMLFQDLRIFTELTALENVQLKNNLTGYKKKKEILSLFEKLGISDKLNVKAGKLSFGQQQRVAFIRAFCQPFDFLFLDEPISHLDDENSRIMGEIIIDEAGKQSAGVIATSIGKHIELPYKQVLQL